MQVKGYQALDAIIHEAATVLLEQDAYKTCRQMIERFKADDASIRQYEQFSEFQRTLQAKEEEGLPPSEQENENFNQIERALYENTIIRQYLFAQKELTHLEQSISEFFNKTIEIGRIPQVKELTKITHGCGSHR